MMTLDMIFFALEFSEKISYTVKAMEKNFSA